MTDTSELRKEASGGPSPTPTGVATRSAGVKAALVALRTYKLYASPWFAGSCRFEPTCSVYAYQAIERFGLRRGAWMALKRLARCHPLSRKFGYDPVAEPSPAETPRSADVAQEIGGAHGACKGAHS